MLGRLGLEEKLRGSPCHVAVAQTTGTQNGTLASPNMDQHLRTPSCLILSHGHVLTCLFFGGGVDVLPNLPCGILHQLNERLPLRFLRLQVGPRFSVPRQAAGTSPRVDPGKK